MLLIAQFGLFVKYMNVECASGCVPSWKDFHFEAVKRFPELKRKAYIVKDEDGIEIEEDIFPFIVVPKKKFFITLEEPLSYEGQSPSYVEPLSYEGQSPSYVEPLSYEGQSPSYVEPLSYEGQSPRYEEPLNYEEQPPKYELNHSGNIEKIHHQNNEAFSMSSEDVNDALENDEDVKKNEEENANAESKVKKEKPDQSTRPKRNLKPLWIGLGIAGGAVVTAGAAVVAAPLVIAGLGFGAGGIVAGSTAATMMSAGPVAAGSLVATLQSIGAAGMGAASIGTAASGGAAVGGGLTATGTYIASLFQKKKKTRADQGSENTHDNPETIVNNQCNSAKEQKIMEESSSNEEVSDLKENIEGNFVHVEDLIGSLKENSGNEGENATSKEKDREQYTVRTKLPSHQEGQNIKKNMSKKERDLPDYSDEVENLERSFAYLGDLKFIMKKQ